MNKPYPVHYDIDHDATIYRAPGLNVREAVMPNEEDSGYSVYVAEDLDTVSCQGAVGDRRSRQQSGQQNDRQYYEADCKEQKFFKNHSQTLLKYFSIVPLIISPASSWSLVFTSSQWM